MNERWVNRGAQGVWAWHRKLAGRRFWFTLVYDGWWGVGPTGQLTVRAERPGLAGYPEYRHEVHRYIVVDLARAEAQLRERFEAQQAWLAELAGRRNHK